MRKILIMSLCFLFTIAGWGQSRYSKIEKGNSFQVSLDKKGKKYLEFTLQDIQYSDSTEYTCNALFIFQVKSIGVGCVLGDMNIKPKKTISIDIPYFLNHEWRGGDTIRASMISNSIIHQDSSVIIQYQMTCKSKNSTYLYVNTQKVAYLDIFYDNKEYYEKLKQEKQRLWEEQQQLWAQDIYESIAPDFTISIADLETCEEDSILIYQTDIFSPNYMSFRESYYLLNQKTIKATIYNENKKYKAVFYFDKISPRLLEYCQKALKTCRQERLKIEQISKLYPIETTTAKDKRTAFLMPQCYTHCVGISFLTIPIIEKEFEVYPVQRVGSTTFYDFGECFVGMRTSYNDIVIQMTLRLYAEKAISFIQEAIDYGYTYIANGENVNVRVNSGELLPDLYSSSVKRYCKKTNKGNVYIEVATSSRYANEYEIAIYR